MKFQKEAGQTLLIIVLVMVVALTVGLSVASRSIVNLRTSTEEDSSQRAFSAAEAGVERVLKTNQQIPAQSSIDLGNNSKISQVQVLPVSGNEFLVNGGNPVSKDDGADIWLATHNADAEQTIDYSTSLSPQFFTIYWGSSANGCSEAAIEVIVISGTIASSLTSKRYVYDPCGSRVASNRFDNNVGSGKTIGGKIFSYSTNITGPHAIPNISNGLLVRVIPLYANTSIGVSTYNPGGNNPTSLPSQGKQIESTGVSGTTTRKITVFQGFPSLPAELFQYVMFVH